MQRRALWTAFLILAGAGAARGATPVAGALVSATWDVAGSPYLVTADILVAGLEIRPGVTVEFQGAYAFEVAGTLSAVGTEAEPVRFVGAPGSDPWRGIFFNRCSPESELVHCRVEGSAQSGVRIENAAPRLERCVITGNSSPAYGGGLDIVVAGTPDPRDVVIEGCDIASGRSADLDGDGIPDEVQRVMARLVPADVPGQIAWDVMLSCDEPAHGWELALTYHPALLTFVEVTAGEDLPAGGMLVSCPPECGDAGAVSRCGEGTAGVALVWAPDEPHAGAHLPVGTHHVARIGFTLVASPPVGADSPLRFVTDDCLGPETAPYRNVFTTASGESVPLFGADVPFAPGYFRRGDANDDGIHDISDSIAILLHLFAGGAAPRCPDAADADDSGEIDVTDAIYLIDWRFRGGSAPPAPFPACGLDATPDDALPECVYLSCY